MKLEDILCRYLGKGQLMSTVIGQPNRYKVNQGQHFKYIIYLFEKKTHQMKKISKIDWNSSTAYSQIYGLKRKEIK